MRHTTAAPLAHSRRYAKCALYEIILVLYWGAKVRRTAAPLAHSQRCAKCVLCKIIYLSYIGVQKCAAPPHHLRIRLGARSARYAKYISVLCWDAKARRPAAPLAHSPRCAKCAPSKILYLSYIGVRTCAALRTTCAFAKVREVRAI